MVNRFRFEMTSLVLGDLILESLLTPSVNTSIYKYLLFTLKYKTNKCLLAFC
jgi:hypothetical protein